MMVLVRNVVYELWRGECFYRQLRLRSRGVEDSGDVVESYWTAACRSDLYIVRCLQRWYIVCLFVYFAIVVFASRAYGNASDNGIVYFYLCSTSRSAGAYNDIDFTVCAFVLCWHI